VNGGYLFDAGPTALQQMRKSRVNPANVKVIFISHFHADHFFGLPFLLLDYWLSERVDDLHLVGPPGIEERTEQLLTLGFPGLPSRSPGYKRLYTEVDDGVDGEMEGIAFKAYEVKHVPALRCFGFSAVTTGRKLAYSGDSVICDGLIRLVAAAEVLILDCSHDDDPVHLRQSDLSTVIAGAPEEATTIVSHLDDAGIVRAANVLIASDLGRFRF
jgi:ribonuclease BN (tRNA processing enzyme)